MTDRPDLIPVPKRQAHHTSWALGIEQDTGMYIFVLHDKDDKPIASTAQTFKEWMVIFQALVVLEVSQLMAKFATKH